MKRNLILLLLVINIFPIAAQTLILEGTDYSSAITGVWGGVNIARNQPVSLIFRNNSITSVNSEGYMLQAGDEAPLSSNNNLDDEIITGNWFNWNGPYSPTIITHGLFAGYNINSVVKYNYLLDVPYGIIFKSGTDAGVNMTFTSGGCAYNIWKNGKFAGRVKGINGVKFYNNTFYSGDGTGWYLLLITANMDRAIPAPSTGTKIFNNIFYSTIQIPMIKIESGCLANFESDYNLYYCSVGNPTFNIDGSTVTWEQWKARGYDTHSVIMNPDFINTTDFVPRNRLNYGTNLGPEFQAGLSTTATWVTGTSPQTVIQNGTWQVGARIYSSEVIPVTGVSVTSANGLSVITSDNGTLQLNATVVPDNATEKGVDWSITNGTGSATINASGLVTAVTNGTVTARATAADGSGTFGNFTITISNQVVPVSSITVTGFGGASTINTDNGSLALTATVMPANATDKSVAWSLTNGTGQATISPAGVVTAIDNGTVTATATANDGSNITGSLVITITKQVIPVTGISVNGAGGSTSIATDNGTLQLSATVLPSNATDKTVTWSVQNGTGQATISSNGLVTAVDNGTVTAIATANDGSAISGNLVLNISNQLISVTGITVSGTGGANTITTDNGTLQLIDDVLPSNASNKSVTWSLINAGGLATISASGLVTAEDNGTVTAKATANDGSAVYGTFAITITNQVIPVSGITVSGAGGSSTITADDGSLQLAAAVAPVNASVKTITWSITNGTGNATISPAGLVSALDNGTVTARATANDGSGIFGTLLITISNQVIQVSGITVTGQSGLSVITTDNGTLQLSADVLPSDATNKIVTWSLSNGTGQATINASGLVSAVDNGTVTARATATDGSGIFGTLLITISNQIVPVTGITVSGTGGARIINVENGTLQLIADVLPANATNKSVTWSIINGTGQASINSTGLVTAIVDGTVTAYATANDGSGIVNSMVITISTTLITVSGVTVTAAGGINYIDTDNGTLQLSANVLPANATDNTVTWSLVNGTGQATINAAGLVSATDNGTVTARATANDGSGVFGTLVITISNQIVLVTGITITGASGETIITADNGTLQLTAGILPLDASDKTVTWSIVNGTGQASISASGLVTAIDNGTVTARATANDASGVFNTIVLTISNQIIPVSGIAVSGAGGLSTISTDNGTLQLTAAVLPANASDNAVIWSIINGTGSADINSSGLVTAFENGTVTARATAADGSGVFGTLLLTITNQIKLVTGIAVSGTGGVSSITADNGTLQLLVTISPLDATDKSVSWSIITGTGLASINASGLVTAIDNGTITVKASAADGSGIYGTMVISLSNQILPVSVITVTGAGGASSIGTDHGSLQLNADVLPVNATNSTVTWSLVNGTGQAGINTSGRVTAIDNGTVTAKATANDGSGVFGTLVITITNQIIPVTGLVVSGAGGISDISTDNGTLQLNTAVTPSNATDKSVTWTVLNGTGQASINASGLLTAIDNGTVTAMATANDGSGISGTLVVTITNQIVNVSGVIVTGTGGASIITTDNGTLQMIATVSPSNATNKTVTWTVVNGTGQATISATGLVTALENGTVRTWATANDGSGFKDDLLVTIFNQVTPVTGIAVTGTGGVSTISTNNGSLQLIASVSPASATDKSVTWSLVNGTGKANINASGLVTALDNGTVTARATANDGSGVSNTMVITISNQTGPVTSITVTGAGGATSINTDNGSLQLTALVLPANATVKTVTWSFLNTTTLATINSSGLLTAVNNGVVTVKATARDGSGVYGTLNITLTNQIVPVTAITVSGAGGQSSIFVDNGTLQLSAEVLPANVLNKTVTWSITNSSGQATISSTGLVSAITNGTVIAIATANDGSGVYGTLGITISSQTVPVTGITLTGAGGVSSISSDNGTLQINSAVLPANATNKTVTWSVLNTTGKASISSTGLVTAIENGNVTALATANDGSGVYGTIVLTITNQLIPVTGITISGTGGLTTIDNDNGTLQLIASILPLNATNKSVTWSIVNQTGEANLSATGLLTAIANGTVSVKATANDGSSAYGTIIISISGQIVPVTKITLNGTNGENVITTNNNTLQLNAVVTPINASDQSVTWSIVSGNGLAVINSEGLVTAIDNGKIVARATANDGSGIFGLMEIPIIIENSDLISVFVTRDEMRIQLNSNYISWKASLYNFQGSQVYSKTVESELVTIDVSKLPSGVYVIALSNGPNLKVARTIIP